ncbi:hypothetical protein V2G26_020859 [Clonostachys chloroleuca]
MGKKRKAPRSGDQPKGPREVDDADARLGPITTYEDVANSEDEFFLARDDLMLDDDEPGSKRRRRADDDIELSDEEVLGYDESDSEDEKPKAKSKKGKRGSKADASDEEEEAGEDEEGDEGWWGSSRKEYYNADQIETEADALEEEAEAKRLQQKKLSKMTDEDFIFDQDEWLEAEPEEGEEDEDKVTEVLKDIEVTDDMSVEERYKLLKARYPEFEHLVKELEVHHPLLETLKADTKNSTGKSLNDVKYWVLGCYVAALASYFAVMTSPARDASKAQKSLEPSELRDHEIMETLLSCREAWRKVKDLKSSTAALDTDADITLHDADELNGDLQLKKLKKAKSKEEKAAAAKRAKKLEKARLWRKPLQTCTTCQLAPHPRRRARRRLPRRRMRPKTQIPTLEKRRHWMTAPPLTRLLARSHSSSTLPKSRKRPTAVLVLVAMLVVIWIFPTESVLRIAKSAYLPRRRNEARRDPSLAPTWETTATKMMELLPSLSETMRTNTTTWLHTRPRARRRIS